MLPSFSLCSTTTATLKKTQNFINSEKILDPEIPHALRLQAILIGKERERERAVLVVF